MGSWETNEEPMEAALIEAASGVAGIGAVAGLAVLLPMEAGIPVPLPADLVMLTVGARGRGGGHPVVGRRACLRGDRSDWYRGVVPSRARARSRLRRSRRTTNWAQRLPPGARERPSRAARNARTRYRSRNAWAPDPYRRRRRRHRPVDSPSPATAGYREQHLLATASFLGLLPRRCGPSHAPGGYRSGPGTDRRRDTGRSHLLGCSSGTTRRCRGGGRGCVSGVFTTRVVVRATPRTQGASRDASDGSAESLRREGTGDRLSHLPGVRWRAEWLQSG